MSQRSAVKIWNYLDGVACVYKPADISMGRVRRVLLDKLSQDLNSLKCRDPKKYVNITGDTSKPMKIEVKTSYADHPSVVGPRYMPQDFRLTFANFLGMKTSGVGVIGINDGCKFIDEFKNAQPLRVYHIRGRLGILTKNFFADGPTAYKCNYEYLRSDDINRVVATVQANHQKNLFHLTGVNLKSQEAYEMAVAGLVRPKMKNATVIYNIKCIDFKPPDFTLEVTALNETEEYFVKVIYDIGYFLRNVASTVSIRCVRVGFFTVEHALLKKHWNLDDVLINMKQCYNIIENSEKMGVELQKLGDHSPTVFDDKEFDDDIEVIENEPLTSVDPLLKTY